MHHPPVDPVLSLSLIREQDPEVPELLHLSQSLSTDPGTANQLILFRPRQYRYLILIKGFKMC